MKEELRQKYLLIRKNIPHRQSKNQIIYQKVIHNKQIKKAKTILIYVADNYEVDTLNLIQYFLKEKKVAVPKVEGDIINFYYVSSLEDLKKGAFNILEPLTNKKVTNFQDTVSITPGICFTKDLYRLGYGKGYYDKFYSKHDVYKIGLSYQECLIDSFIPDKNDVRLNEIITD